LEAREKENSTRPSPAGSHCRINDWRRIGPQALYHSWSALMLASPRRFTFVDATKSSYVIGSSRTAMSSCAIAASIRFTAA